MAAFRPGWTAADCRVAVHGVFGLINSVSDQRVAVSRERQATLLRTMALAALTTAVTLSVCRDSGRICGSRGKHW